MYTLKPGSVLGCSLLLPRTRRHALQIRVYESHRSIFELRNREAISTLGIDLGSTGTTAQNFASQGVTPNEQPIAEAPNNNQPHPALAVATPNEVSGLACPGCTVEVFKADSGAPPPYKTHSRCAADAKREEVNNEAEFHQRDLLQQPLSCFALPKAKTQRSQSDV